MTTDNNSAFIYNLKKAAQHEGLSYYAPGVLGNHTAENAILFALEELDADTFNRVVTCNPKYEIFSTRTVRTSTLNNRAQ